MALYPQFLFEEFVDQNILNTAMSSMVTYARNLGSQPTFFIPGILNPSSLTFGFNGNLIVTVNTPSPFGVMFSSGAIVNGVGNTDGQTSSSYNVSLAGLVPSVGSQTVYIVATYSTIQQDPTVITGAPPGHPDYSASFLPYVGYTGVQETLTIAGTITVPDNKVTVELARLTLTAGQTQITSVDTSHQVDASLNVNLTLNGDVTGPLSANIVNKSSAATFTANNITANGALNVTGAAAIGGALSAHSISTPTTVTAGGEIFGANASANNAALMKGQFTSAVGTDGWMSIPVVDSFHGNISVIYQWGQSSAFSQPAGTVININFPRVFPTAVFQIAGLMDDGSPYGPTGVIVTGSITRSGFQYAYTDDPASPTPMNLIHWIAIGY